MKQTGAAIRSLRTERGLSQEELGERADFHFSYIGKVERGEVNITLVNLERIANSLEVGLHQLFPFSIALEGLTDKERHIESIVELLKNQDLNKVLKAENIIEELLR
ncbi:helix-turn-helix domain-containing protein [Paenibacillus auburnensis]|uniref:helix-turn-helix domain-containing protein n=1 Tax=Paenibacillus auburnensis TaxID=2905649 RepID=UPI001F324631|nr:helix-turn-helix transcriptional regulator [Paenibacillus auburnensis]